MSSREVIKSDDNPEIQPIRQLTYLLMTTYQRRHWFLGRRQKLLSPVSLRGRTHLHIRCVGWAQEGLPAESQNGTQTKRCKLCHRSSQSRLIFFNNDHCHFILVDPHFMILHYPVFYSNGFGVLLYQHYHDQQQFRKCASISYNIASTPKSSLSNNHWKNLLDLIQTRLKLLLLENFVQSIGT